MENTVTDIWNFVIPLFGGVIIMFFVYVIFEELWIPFWEHRKYLKAEIARTYGEERKYWKKKLRRFYLRSIPVLGLFFRKKR